VRAVLSLGSNLGDREQTIRDAVADIRRLPDVAVVAASSLVETPAVKPHGVDHEAPTYLNAAVIVTTDLAPEALLAELNRIELEHHRVREERWGDRTLDIDIITIDDLRQETATLTLPHPRAAERNFVLVPWLEIEPDAVLPGIGRVDTLLPGAPDVRRYPAEDLS
jgi:2-amino-4-hydroxy-6-hydroxymethyldihydropteridine diphosphokinase